MDGERAKVGRNAIVFCNFYARVAIYGVLYIAPAIVSSLLKVFMIS